MLNIMPRTVKEISGMRPFQKSTLDALDANAKIIVVEAPVGAGKSHIVRQVIDHWEGPVVLTYPTKILMESQKASLKSEFPDSVIWPFEKGIPRNDAPTIFYYSSDTMISWLKLQNADYHLDRSELIHKVFSQQFYASRNNILLTSPDVLHILYNMEAYRGSQRLKSFLTKALIVFDEFHLYVGLKHFPKLILNLFESGIGKIILLSATSVVSEEIKILMQKYGAVWVDFSESIGAPDDKTFNYPLRVEFVNCRYTRRDILIEILKKYIPMLPKPLAIIVDSVFRLRHVLPALRKEFGADWEIVEYSGFAKEQLKMDDETILVGTSSIEVGINMVFKSLITEASFWTSAIQRIGRAGRFCEGDVVVLTTKNITPYIEDDNATITRDALENDILKGAFKDIKMSYVCGDMFRGDSYNFLLYDVSTKRLTAYSESIFAMFEMTNRVSDWQTLSMERKKIILERYTNSDEEITEILLRDRVFPFWGLVEGRLRDKYERILTHAEDDELTIICEESNTKFTFDRGR